MKEHPEFSDAIKGDKDQADEHVAASFYHVGRRGGSGYREGG